MFLPRLPFSPPLMLVLPHLFPSSAPLCPLFLSLTPPFLRPLLSIVYTSLLSFQNACTSSILLRLLLFLSPSTPAPSLQSVASADMDGAQLEAFLSAQSRKQGGGGGVTAEQAAALSRFWKSGRGRVREVLVAQSCWEPALRGVSWRVDLQSASSRCVDGRDDNQSGPVALVELEVGRIGEVGAAHAPKF